MKKFMFAAVIVLLLILSVTYNQSDAMNDIGPAVAENTNVNSKPSQPDTKKTEPKKVDEYKVLLVNDNFVFRPHIFMDGNDSVAGTAFAMKLDESESPIIVTVHHIFGPAGGFESRVDSSELKDHVEKVELLDLFDKEYIGTVTEVITNPNGHPIMGTDIAAFKVNEEFTTSPRIMAKKNPEQGDAVWLIANIDQGKAIVDKVYRGKVSKVQSGLIYFEYNDPNLSLDATSGAPVINANGEVVGVNMGGELDDGVLVGVATACETFGPLLRKSLNEQ